MSVFDGIRNIFKDEDEEEKKVQQTSASMFEPYYHTDYLENRDLYDQAHHYWTTGEYPVVQYDEKKKTGYEQEYNNDLRLDYSLSASSPLFYKIHEYDVVNKSKEELEEEARNKRGTLDRIFGMISNNSLIQGAYYALDNDEETTFGQGVREGFRYMNPFEDDVTNRKSFHDVIELFDDDPTDDKFGENAIEAVLGFAGDVLLDPTTYITGGASAIGKVVKGSGAVVDGASFVNKATGEIVENADEVANLFKTAKDTVESAKKVENAKKSVAKNLYKDLGEDSKNILVMDVDTAKTVLRSYDDIKHYSDDEINNMAENLVKGFNKTMFGLETGGQDLTIFGQKLVSANTFRNIGDKTIAPYYNKLATKIRQTKVANKFGTNPYSKTAYNDLTDAFRPYFNNFILNQNKIKIAKGAKEAQDFVMDNLDKLDPHERELALKYMDDGTYRKAKFFHEKSFELYQKALKQAKKTDPEYANLAKKVEWSKNQIDYLESVESMLLGEAKKPISTEILEFVGLRKKNKGQLTDEQITAELSSRGEELEKLFGKTFDNFTEEERNLAKQLVEIEHDPVFGVFGELSAFNSGQKSIFEILYDYGTDDSVYDFAKTSNIKNTINSLFGGEIEHTGALKAASESYRTSLKEELSGLYKQSSINSGNFGKKTARQYAQVRNMSAEELRARCDVLSIFDKANRDGYYVRTYGDDVKRVQNALIEASEELSRIQANIQKYIDMGNPKMAEIQARSYERYNKELFSLDGLLKLIKDNASDSAFYSDVEEAFKAIGRFADGSRELPDVALTENLLAGLKKKINAGLVVSKKKSKNVDPITKMNVIEKLDVGDRIKIANSIMETNKTRFFSYLDTLSNEEIYQKYLSYNSNASMEIRDVVVDHLVKNAYITSEAGIPMLDVSKLDEFTTQILSERVAESVKKLKFNLDKTTKALTIKDAELLENSKNIIDNYYMREAMLTAEELATIKELTPDKQIYQVMKKFQDKMAEIAKKERSLGVLTSEQITAMQDRYVKYMLTPEAQKLYANNAEAFNRLGFYAEGISVTKRSNKSRKYPTLEAAEKAMQKAFPNSEVEKFFETDLAKIYCARCLESDRLIGQKENMSYILSNFAHPYTGKGSVSSGRSLVVNYEELTKALMKAQDVRPMSLGGTPTNIDFSVLKQFGIDPDFVTANNPFIRVGEDEFEALNQYIINSVGEQPLDDLVKASQTTEETAYFKQIQEEWKTWQNGKKSVSGYAMGDDIIEMVNQNSMAQNSLSESAFWKLYDKFLSTYKMINTIYSPAFYGNNALGNAFNSFLYSGAAAFDPNKLKIARGIASTGDPQQFLTLHGEKYSYKQLRELCSRLGISNTSFYEHEIREYASKFANFALNKKLLELSSGIEDTQRIALFVEALDNTGDLEQAVNIVNKFLFDYSDLTDFEHKVMKRAIPFYTFMRKNAPMQLEQIFTNPRKYRNLNYGFNNIEVMAGTNYVEDYERNDWRRDYIQTPFQINGENIGVNLNLPYQQLERLTPNKIFGQTSPAIKAIPELMAGKYAYTGMDINSTGEYIANQISPLNKAFGLFNQDNGLDTALYAASQSGINFATIDNQLENQKELIEEYYPYVNSENVGFDDDGILEALIKKYKGVDE